MAKKKFNITIDPDVLEDFCYHSSKYGTSISAWIEVQMKEFIEEEKEVEEFRRNLRKGKGTT